MGLRFASCSDIAQPAFMPVPVLDGRLYDEPISPTHIQPARHTYTLLASVRLVIDNILFIHNDPDFLSFRVFPALSMHSITT